jgi:anti-sigma B factor antagonist
MRTAEHPFSFRVKDHGKALYVVLEGELDVATAPTLHDYMRAAINSAVREDVCLDGSCLDYVDSAGLSLLVSLQKRAQANGTSFTIGFPSRQFLKMLQVTGLEDFFNLANPVWPRAITEP